MLNCILFKFPGSKMQNQESHCVTRSFLLPHLIPMAAPALLCWYAQVDETQGVLLYQHKRASQRSVKVYPRCGSKKDLVTPFLPGFLNKIR